MTVAESIAGRLPGLFGREVENNTKVSTSERKADEVFFNSHYLNQSVEVEGFGRVELTPSGDIRIGSEQLLRLKEHETKEGLIPSESFSLEDGTFLVKLKKSES